jgi:hypothetical protein
MRSRKSNPRKTPSQSPKRLRGSAQSLYGINELFTSRKGTPCAVIILRPSATFSARAFDLSSEVILEFHV